MVEVIDVRVRFLRVIMTRDYYIVYLDSDDEIILDHGALVNRDVKRVPVACFGIGSIPRFILHDRVIVGLPTLLNFWREKEHPICSRKTLLRLRLDE
jgi:hypothetical protein